MKEVTREMMRIYGYKASNEVQSKILVSKEKSHKKSKTSVRNRTFSSRSYFVTRSYSQEQPTQYKRDEKTTPTEELLKMTELMLKNNYFESGNEMK